MHPQLRTFGVDDDRARQAVDDEQMMAALARQGAPKALHGDLEVDDRLGGAHVHRHHGRVRDHPHVHVGREVRSGLEHLAHAYAEGRVEERMDVLVTRKLGGKRVAPPDDARVLEARAVDEARLSERARIELLQIGKRLVHALEGPAASHALRVLSVEVAENGVLGGEQCDRARTVEVRFEVGGARVRVRGERAVERAPVLTPRLALDDERADHEGDQPNREHEQEHPRHAPEAGWAPHSSVST